MIAEDWNMQIIKSQQIILRKIGILVRVVHLGLIIIAPPISVFVLVDLNLSQGLTHVLPSEERTYDLQHCYIEWSRSRLLKYDFFLFRTHLRKRRKEEEHKHGIFFDDDYDYLQHVKPRTNPTLEPLPVNISVMEAKKLSGPLHIQVFLQIAWLLWMKAYNLQHCHTANAWIFSWGSCNYQVRYLDPDMNSQKACSTLLHHHTVILHFLVDIRFS